jgi:hypothetical protein
MEPFLKKALMNRYNIVNAWLLAMLLAGIVLPSGSVRAQGGGETTIAILISVRSGQPTATAVAAMKEIKAYVSKQPGLIDQTLLASSVPGNRPSHIHVMRWRLLSDWEAVMTSTEFRSLLERDGRYIQLNAANAFQPVP